jgi:hypothetical protein
MVVRCVLGQSIRRVRQMCEQQAHERGRGGGKTTVQPGCVVGRSERGGVFAFEGLSGEGCAGGGRSALSMHGLRRTVLHRFAEWAGQGQAGYWRRRVCLVQLVAALCVISNRVRCLSSGGCAGFVGSAALRNISSLTVTGCLAAGSTGGGS